MSNCPQGVSACVCSVECSRSLRVGGSLVSSAVVPPRATWAEAERAVKMDVLRSVMARLELLSQDMSRQRKEDPVIKVEEPMQWGFPRRVAVTMDSTPFPLSDYCFEDESDKVCPLAKPQCHNGLTPPPTPLPPQDSVQRIAELLSVDPSTLEVTSVEGGAALEGGAHSEEEGHGGAPPTPPLPAGKGELGLQHRPCLGVVHLCTPLQEVGIYWA